MLAMLQECPGSVQVGEAPGLKARITAGLVSSRGPPIRLMQ